MKKYILKAVIDNDYILFDKNYSSTSEALNAGFNYLENELGLDVYVEEEFKNEANNNVEYILSNHDRLIVARA